MKLLGLLIYSFFFIGLSLQALTKQQLTTRRLASPNGIIQVTDDDFDSIFEGEKDYYLVTLLTAVENQKCELCAVMKPIYETVVKAYYNSYPEFDRVFFVNIEANKNSKHFQAYKLNTVPHLWVYPISSTIYKPEDNNDPYDKRIPMPPVIGFMSEHYTYPIGGNQGPAERELELAQFLGQLTQSKIIISRPLELKVVFTYFAGFFVVFKLLKSKRDHIIANLKNGKFWMFLSILLIYVNLSGFNFSLQRNVPFLVKSKEGIVQYLVPGVQNQIGSELVISIVFQASFSVLLWLTIDEIPRLPQKRQALGMVVFGLLIFVNYNIFTTAFKIKDNSYPFTFIQIPVF